MSRPARTVASKELATPGRGVVRLESDAAGHVSLVCSGCGTDRFEQGMAPALQSLQVHSASCEARPDRGLRGYLRERRSWRRDRTAYAIVGYLLIKNAARTGYQIWDEVSGPNSFGPRQFYAVLEWMEREGAVVSEPFDTGGKGAPQRLYQLSAVMLSSGI